MQDEERVIKLLDKRNKKYKRIVFSRSLLIFTLIVIQVFIFLGTYLWFREYFPNFVVVEAIFSFSMLIYLFNCGMDSSAKLTWLAMIMMFPLPAVLMLFYTKVDTGQWAAKKRVFQMIEESRGKLLQDEETFRSAEIVSSGADDLCRYLNKTGCYPIFRNTAVKYFPTGEDKFDALIAELEKAEHFIFMEYFIIDEGYMWGRILSILEKKAEQGVEVRVMYDGMCEISTLSYDYAQRMARLGIKCRSFSPIQPFISTHYNYRDHRKITVIDGRTAFTGGVNLADEYINVKERFGHWKDAAIMVKGEAVRSFTLMFLQMWNVYERDRKWEEYLEAKPDELTARGFVMPYGDNPFDDYKVGENVYMDILNRATEYVHFMSPYLILDGELETALKFAAERGIDVKLILPGIPDKKVAYSLAKSHYRSLLGAGVKIFEYTPGFVHSKVCVSDDEKAVVGTINLDYRSLYHHFECAAYMYGTECIHDIESDFLNTLKECREVTYETIKHEKLYYKVVGKLVKIIAPLI